MLPVIGRAPRHAGLWFDFGHQHHGLTLGPVTGRLLAEMMTGETPFADPSALCGRAVWLTIAALMQRGSRGPLTGSTKVACVVWPVAAILRLLSNAIRSRHEGKR